VKNENKHAYSFSAEPRDFVREFNILAYSTLNLKKLIKYINPNLVSFFLSLPFTYYNFIVTFIFLTWDTTRTEI
jgi:hypothetical protein